MRARAALIPAVLALASLGCDPLSSAGCDRSAEGNPAVRYTEGTVGDGVYMSSPWDGELLYFPGGMHYALEHKLGVAPRWIASYLSFDRNGTRGGTLAPAAGNQVVLIDVDATAITVANDSCVDYWLLVTAGTGAE
jgi:hypothetical protein